MNLNQMRQFKQAAESENISNAADKLYISQSALTKAVRRFEEEVGAELFDRNGKNVALNAKGKLALHYVNMILESADAMKEGVMALEHKGKGIRLGTNLPNVVRYVTPLFRLEHPDQLVQEKFYDMLQMDRDLLDQGIQDMFLTSVLPQNMDGLESVLLLTDSIVVHVPEESDLALKQNLMVKDLEGQKIVLAESTRIGYVMPYFETYIRKKKLDLDCVYVPDTSALEHFLKVSEYITVSTKFTEYFFRIPYRISRGLQEVELEIPYYAVYRTDAKERAVDLIAWMKKKFQLDEKQSFS